MRVVDDDIADMPETVGRPGRGVALALVGEAEVVGAEDVAVVELDPFAQLHREYVGIARAIEGPGLSEPVDAIAVRVDVQELLVEQGDEVLVEAAERLRGVDLRRLYGKGDHHLVVGPRACGAERERDGQHGTGQPRQQTADVLHFG